MVPLVENKKGSKFRTFLVSWFLGFLVSWCLDFFVSKLQSFKVSKFQRLKIDESLFLEDLDPILPTFDFMFSGTDGSRIQDFQECVRRAFMILGARLFRYFQKMISEKNDISHNNTFPKWFWDSSDFLRYLGV